MTTRAPDAFTERRRQFRDRMEALRKRLMHIDDPVARDVLASLVDSLEELLRVWPWRA